MHPMYLSRYVFPIQPQRTMACRREPQPRVHTRPGVAPCVLPPTRRHRCGAVSPAPLRRCLTTTAIPPLPAAAAAAAAAATAATAAAAAAVAAPAAARPLWRPAGALPTGSGVGSGGSEAERLQRRQWKTLGGRGTAAEPSIRTSTVATPCAPAPAPQAEGQAAAGARGVTRSGGGGAAQRCCLAARSRLCSPHVPRGVSIMWAYLTSLFGDWFRLLAGRRQTRLLMVGLDGACATWARPAGEGGGGGGEGVRSRVVFGWRLTCKWKGGRRWVCGGGRLPRPAMRLRGGSGLTDSPRIVSAFWHWDLQPERITGPVGVTVDARVGGGGGQGQARPPSCSSSSWASSSTPSPPLVRCPCHFRGVVWRLLDSCLGYQPLWRWGWWLLLPRAPRWLTRQTDRCDWGAHAFAFGFRAPGWR